MIPPLIHFPHCDRKSFFLKCDSDPITPLLRVLHAFSIASLHGLHAPSLHSPLPPCAPATHCSPHSSAMAHLAPFFCGAHSTGMYPAPPRFGKLTTSLKTQFNSHFNYEASRRRGKYTQWDITQPKRNEILLFAAS